jgi:hypothetical protein
MKQLRVNSYITMPFHLKKQALPLFDKHVDKSQIPNMSQTQDNNKMFLNKSLRISSI